MHTIDCIQLGHFSLNVLFSGFVAELAVMVDRDVSMSGSLCQIS